jgi:hypothetical protein
MRAIAINVIAMRAGAGVVGLPGFLGDRDRDLVITYEDVPSLARDIWLMVHRDLCRTPADRGKTRPQVGSASYRCVQEPCRESLLRPTGRGRIKVAETRCGDEFSHGLPEVRTVMDFVAVVISKNRDLSIRQ